MDNISNTLGNLNNLTDREKYYPSISSIKNQQQCESVPILGCDMDHGTLNNIISEAMRGIQKELLTKEQKLEIAECILNFSTNWEPNKFKDHETAVATLTNQFRCIVATNLQILRNNLIIVPNFPKHGVMFQDLSKILANPILLNLLVESLEQLVRQKLPLKITKIVGLDSRGYIYGMALAIKLNCGFIMARKAGKTPNAKESVTCKTMNYITEYSQTSIEIMDGLLDESDVVLLVDDLVATGGSLCAARDLVKQYNAIVAGALTVLCVDELILTANRNFNSSLLVLL